MLVHTSCMFGSIKDHGMHTMYITYWSVFVTAKACRDCSGISILGTGHHWGVLGSRTLTWKLNIQHYNCVTFQLSTVNKCIKILLNNQLHQSYVSNKSFWDLLCLHHQSQCFGHWNEWHWTKYSSKKPGWKGINFSSFALVVSTHTLYSTTR
jgi:hypothetical protein